MTNISDSVHRYRLAVRHIWNTCFWADPDLRFSESIVCFGKIKFPLFVAVVAEPLGIPADTHIFGVGFKVIPNVASKGGPVLPSLLVRRGSGGHFTWQQLDGAFKANELSLTLLDFFDWSHMGYMDLRYYRVRIEGFAEHPNEIGNDGLVDVNYADVYWTGPIDS